jgi:beta-phosphoglucomutase-like phosphatase (HAD superfamily)
MVFNDGMNTHDSRKIIEAAGGDRAFARLLGLELRPGIQQRINNWKRRGIPASVVLSHFEAIDRLRSLTAKGAATSTEPREAA